MRINTNTKQKKNALYAKMKNLAYGAFLLNIIAVLRSALYNRHITISGQQFAPNKAGGSSMKTRQEIKATAKGAMKAQRGTSIVTLLLVMVVAGGVGFVAGIISAIVAFLGMLLMWGAIFFVALPLAVNSNAIYVKIYKGEQASANELFSNFKDNYMRKVGGMAWMMLFEALWMFVPIYGIVKAISYSMTPYILANNPNVTAKQALKLSMRMTDGHKMDLFVMNLSFFGWHMLGMLTCGILSIAFTLPYHSTTSAGYFVELRNKAISTGVIHESELTGRLQ